MSLEVLGGLGPLGQVPREHVRGARRGARHRGGRPGAHRQGRPDGAQADELPGAYPDLQPGHQELSRPADAHGRVRLLPSQRGARRAARPAARAPDDAGRRPHLLHRGADPVRDRALRPPALFGLRATWASTTSSSSWRRGRKSSAAPSSAGTRPRRRWAMPCAPPATTSSSPRARARSTRPSSSSTSRTPSAAPGRWARCSSTTCCPSGSTRPMSPRTARANTP